MTKRQIDWEAVAKEYHASDMPVPEIACKHGLAPITIYAKAKRAGWARPGGSGLKTKDNSRAATKREFGKPSNRSANKPGEMPHETINSSRALGRMMGIVNRLADELERHLDHPDKPGMSATEKKGAADILTSLARALEKLTVLEREATVSAKVAEERGQQENMAGAEDGWDEVQCRLARLAAAKAEG